MGKLTEVKKGRIIEALGRPGDIASKITWAHGANSALATFLPVVVLWSALCPPQR